LLSAKNLAKSYRERHVVEDFSATVAPGQVVGLLGPNGAGKTTCFYMIVGLVSADRGQISVDGTDVTHLPMHLRARAGVGYLPQEQSIFRRLTVEQNLLAALELRADLSREARSNELDRLLKDLQVEHLRKQLGVSLSGGERRRVEIARALASNPKYMLLDEPFAGVDPISVVEIQRIVRHLKSRGIGVLITDHNVRETLGICDHAYILNQGLVLARGKPHEILANDEVRNVYLGKEFQM